MSIADSIKEARRMGASDQEILQEIVRQNPGRKKSIDEAKSRGANPTQILNEIIRRQKQMTASAVPPRPSAPPEKERAEKIPPETGKTAAELKMEEAQRRLETLSRLQDEGKTEEISQTQASQTPPRPEQPAKPAMPAKPKLEPGPEMEISQLKPEEKTGRMPTIPVPPRPIKKPPMPPPSAQAPAPGQQFMPRPIPKKPSSQEKIWVRIVVFGLALILLAVIATFWYWYLVIRVQPPATTETTTGSGPIAQPGTPPPTPEPQISPSLFQVEDTRTLSIASASELKTQLQQVLQEWLDTNQVRRIVIKNTTENKILGLKNFFEAILMRAPDQFYANLENDFTLFIASQPEGNRFGLAVKIKNTDDLAALLKNQEATMEDDYKTLFEVMGKTAPAISKNFLNASQIKGYLGPDFRYKSLTKQDLTIAYLVSGDYFVLTGSLKSMDKAVARLAIPVLLTQTLRVGSSGREVSLLQTWLKTDPEIFPNGKVDGYFGNATKAAVIKFQEKYAADILVPQGLTAGNGIVDAYTRNKLNELFAKPK